MDGEVSQNDFPDGGLFDPDQTLSYMWGDDPDPTLPSMFEEDPQPADPPESQFLGDTDSSSQPLAGDSDSDSNVRATDYKGWSENTIASSLQRLRGMFCSYVHLTSVFEMINASSLTFRDHYQYQRHCFIFHHALCCSVS